MLWKKCGGGRCGIYNKPNEIEKSNVFAEIYCDHSFVDKFVSHSGCNHISVLLIYEDFLLL